ncbi:MAG TPA: M28 family peptidase [Actinomycetota bacterium]|nr:M28 family peptidase [Actinomycetota bacterium]
MIDVDYLYRQLWYMSVHYLARYSGFDGDPRTPLAITNLPPEVNGWQEFYAHWKGEMQSERSMGPMARYVTVADHYFHTLVFAPYDSDVAEVTLPGATCPGRRVLLAAHPDGTPGLNTQNGSAYDDTSGVTMGMAEFQALLRWYQANGTWPKRTIKIGLFDAEETGLFGSYYYAEHLIPKGPQGQYVMVANMDQNGMEYPAYHLGTTHYTSDLVNGVGPWRTNINASPLRQNDIYTGDDWKRIQRNLPAIRRFRQALDDSVKLAFQVLGRKYGFTVPLENPIEFGRQVSAYTESDRLAYSPVQDDTLGRTDQVPFVALGIPGYGVLGAFDSTETENPYPEQLPVKPTIPQYAGYDTPRDTIFHLNLMTAGRPFGAFTGDLTFPDAGTQELRRALELPATWTDYLVSRPEYGGAVLRPSGPVAYFETDPVQPDGPTVTFDAGFTADPGGHGGLTFAWTFGDGGKATGMRVTHTFKGARFADVRLVVRDRSGRIGTYRQAVALGAHPGRVPATPACGLLSSAEANAVLRANGLA